MNHVAVLWTARLCIGCYLLRYLVGTRGGPGSRQWQRRLWTAGWVVLVLHTAAVFQFVHDWSHKEAVAHTARQTKALLGFPYGAGVWFNYATIVIWGADVARWWIADGNPGDLWSFAVHAYLAMIVVSATVVFGPRYWWGVAAVVVVALFLASRERQRPEHADS